MDKKQIISDAKAFFDRADIKAEFERDLARLIEIDSVVSDADGIYPYGKKPAMALDAALDMGKAYGFDTHNYEYHCGTIAYGDKTREVGIVGHLDVVPCGNGWSYPPYKLTVDGDKYIGRGTEDDKGPVLIGLYVMRFLKEQGYDLPFTVKLIAGSDEEVGSSDLAYFSKVAQAPWFSFTPDSEFPVCIGEKNIIALKIDLGKLPECIADINGGVVSNAVPDVATALVKGYDSLPECDGITLEHKDGGILVTASGKGAHAAMPETGINAIAKLASYLGKNVCSCKAFDFISTAASEYLGNTLDIAATDTDFGYLTCVGSMIRYDGASAVMTFNIRAIPGVGEDSFEDTVAKAVSKYDAKVTLVRMSKGYHFSPTDAKILALNGACSEVLGVECKPYTMGGGTYAKELKNCVAFGAVLPNQYSDSDVGGAHQRDEAIKRSDMAKAFAIYALSILSLAEGLNDGTIS